MSNAVKASEFADDITQIQDILEEQKAAFLQNSNPTLDVRVSRLKKLRKVLVDNKDAFAQAISEDFRGRSVHETQLGEIMTLVDHIDQTIKHLPKWMKNESRALSKLFLPGKAWVQYQPLGVVGIISPWNYPMLLGLGPLISALAAGNSAMMKPSSAIPAYTALLAEKLAAEFSRSVIHVVQGSGELSKAFSKLNFDQMTFTGSSRVGRVIMSDAAANLTPVLLELGGKSPAIIHPSYDMAEAVVRICVGKFWNAGQTCVAPDYIMVPKGKTEEFVRLMKERLTTCYPSFVNNPDYTSVINDGAKADLVAMREDARTKGATVVELNPADEKFDDSPKLPPTFIYNTTEDMKICQEEIFGPLVLVKEYTHIDDAIAYINSKPHPLALYYFDEDEARADYLAKRTRSGHFGINQALTHVAQDDIPFGGVGNSGMGKYHGIEGFRSMNNARSVMKHGSIYSMKLSAPPFGKVADMILRMFLR